MTSYARTVGIVVVIIVCSRFLGDEGFITSTEAIGLRACVGSVSVDSLSGFE